MRNKNFLLSIIIPVYNEEMVIKQTFYDLYKVINEYNYEIIFINDGSLDDTMNILLELSKINKKVKIIELSRNFGQENAITAGLHNCKGDCVVIMDADGQDPVELIPTMIKQWQKGFDIIHAKRNKRIKERFFKKITAKYFYKLLNKMSNINIPINVGEFKLIDKKVCEYFKLFNEKNKYVRGLIAYEGFNQKEILYDRKNRVFGKTNYTLKKMLKLALDAIYSFSYKPLYLDLLLNLSLIIILIIYSIYSLLSLNFKNKEKRHDFYVIFLLIITNFTRSLNNKYIENIHENVLNRPEYIIKNRINI